MKLYYRLIVVLLFALAVSICAGSFFEVSMIGEGKHQLENMLSGLLNAEKAGGENTQTTVSFAGCFFKIFVKNLVIVVLAYVSPAVLITLPVLPTFLLLRGLCFGFSAAMTLEVTGIRGILYIITALLPQNLIQRPVYCVLAALSLQAGAMRIKRAAGRKRNAVQMDARRYSLVYLTGLVIITLSCLLEAFLVTSV